MATVGADVQIDANQLATNTIFIFRPNKTNIQITGTDVAFSVQSGSLVVTVNGVSFMALSPAEWVTVGTPPVT